ncbi:hypothetical protein ACX9MO_15760 [Pseudooceanicola sp. 502str34]
MSPLNDGLNRVAELTGLPQVDFAAEPKFRQMADMHYAMPTTFGGLDVTHHRFTRQQVRKGDWQKEVLQDDMTVQMLAGILYRPDKKETATSLAA